VLPFSPQSDLLEARASLRAEVDECLDKLAAGALPELVERQRVDLKEEAGRRGSGGVLLPGDPHNLAAADHLAREVACLANTPGGGALIVGVEDRSGALFGAALDAEWLRQRIYQRVDVAPAVEERIVAGARLLVVFVAEAREPVEDQDGNLRWRTGSSCQPVHRAEWWLHRQDIAGADPMAAVTSRTVVDVPDGAIVAARAYLQRSGLEGVPRTRSSSELLAWLGVLRPDGHLTQAGALVFCASDRTLLSLSVLDVEGGDVLAAPLDLGGLSLIEQIAVVEQRLDGVNTSITLTGSFAEEPVRRLPPRAIREAVLNGVIHRDWMPRDPVEITWIEADSALQVVSPGGFVGGITAANVLTQRFARYPALADLFRGMNLVDKRGLGVDRMVREMVTLGHRRPIVDEQSNIRVRARLTGGAPVLPVMALVSAIQPAVRRRDVRIALIVHTLLHEPFITADGLVDVLQRDGAECAEAIDTALECRVGDQPLLARVKDVWTLSAAALGLLETKEARLALRSRGVLPYRRPEDPRSVIRAWLMAHDRMTSGDHAALTGLSVGGALRQLERQAAEGFLARGDEIGRNAHFTRGPSFAV
jgi:ATP-dependent DNA helicase RecG